MTELQRITDLLHRAFYGEAWHGPSVLEALSGIGAPLAAARPIPGAHSLWEITLHISAWEDGGRRRLEGEKVELTGEAEWPLVKDDSESAWKETLAQLQQRFDALERVVAGLDVSALDTVQPGRQSTDYFLVQGLIQHALYHAGQISLLKKAF